MEITHLTKSLFQNIETNTVLKCTPSPLYYQDETSKSLQYMQEKEIQALNIIDNRHKNIISIQELRSEIEIGGILWQAIIMEKSQTDLFDYLFTQRSTPSTEVNGEIEAKNEYQDKSPIEQITFMKTVIKQLIEAVNFLHNQDISHNDIKLDNILVFENDLIKLIDFGLSNINAANSKLNITEIQKQEWKQRICNTDYLAPEIVTQILNWESRHDSNQQTYEWIDEKAADIYSIGCVLFASLFGHIPKSANDFENDYFYQCFVQNDMKKLMQKLKQYPQHDKFFESIPEFEIETLFQFFECTLAFHPDNRLTSTQLLNHRWLKI